MDSLTDKEFHKLFDRTSQEVELKGAYTPDEVHRRLRRKRREYREEGDRKSQRNMEKLIASDFGQRVSSESLWDPNGFVGLTVQHGRKRAREILLRRAREKTWNVESSS